ncbi:MAG: haloacid dehalogenase-like hydrolase [Atopobiaceae bacterium]|nr:haloacid dehalogenase-like hydrolase [Atopobiaceae bacterium]
MQNKTQQSFEKPQPIKRIAIFDFDGTVISGQSGFLFAKYLLNRRLSSFTRTIKLAWWGIRYKLHLPYRQEESRELVVGALMPFSVEFSDAVMHDFHREILENLYRPQALLEVERRQNEGCCALLVSATFEPIAELAAKKLGVDGFLATKMQVDSNDHYTSKVDGPVIEGAQKLLSATKWCDEHFGVGNWEIAYAYGDHYSDGTLLEAAKVPCAVCPGPTLAKLAKKRGWTILNW